MNFCFKTLKIKSIESTIKICSLILFFTVLTSFVAKGDTTTVTASKITSSSVTWTGSGGESWSVVINGGATNQNVTNGYAQFGTRNSPSTSGTFSTSGISGTITSIIVDCASYSGLGSVNVTVGGADFGTQSQSIPSWSSNTGGDVTFTGSASGAIVITMTNASNGRAMYIKSITVTYTSGSVTTYTIAASVNPQDAGSVLGTGSYQANASCSLTASANTGYVFSNWTENGSVVSTANPYSFTVTGDRTLVANFTALTQYTISATVDPADAGSVSGAGTYYDGNSCTLRATANSGHSFSHWTLNGSTVSTANPYTFTVNGDAAYVAHFSVSQDYVLVDGTQDSWEGEYLITYITSSDPSTATILTGNSGTYGTATSGFAVSSKTIAADTGDPYKVVIEAVSGTTYYTIKFGDYFLGYSGTGNSLAFNASGSGTSFQWTIEYTSGYTVTITNANYTTRILQYNTSSPRFACYTGTQKNVSLFKKNASAEPHNITVASDITNGTVSVDQNSAVAGTTVTVTTTPDSGYITALVTTTPATTVTGNNNTYTFTMPNADVVVSATFIEPSCNSGNYALVTQASDDWSGEYVIAYGSSGTVTLLNGQNGNYGGTATATVSGGIIDNAHAILYNVTIARNGSCYTLKQGDYYIGNEDNGSYLNFSTTIPVTDPNQYRWVIHYNSGAISIQNACTAYHSQHYLAYSSGNGFYSNTSISSIQLFRRATDAPAAPAFSIYEGLYTDPETVTITSTTSGATIYYTIDGTEPDESSLLYSTPITLNRGTTVLKAVAYNGSCFSTVTTAQYAITGEVVPCSEYHLVTEDQDDWTGNYVITNMSGSTARFLNGVISEPESGVNGGVFYGTFATTDVSSSVETIPSEQVDQCKVTITKVGSYYTMKLGNYYLGMRNDVENRLDYFTELPSGDENKCYWIISYSGGEFSIENVRNTTRCYLGFNNNTGDGYDHSRFACYASNSGNISNAFELYKMSLGNMTTVTATGSEGVMTITIAHDGTIVSTTNDPENIEATYTGSECTDVTLTAALENNYVFVGWYLMDGMDSTLVSTDLQQVVPIDGNTYKAVAYKPDTWVAAVTAAPAGWNLNSIATSDDLAWLISYVNGYNGSGTHPNAVAVLVNDIDMDDHAWVPIGHDATIPFSGTFNGNGHVITGIRTHFDNDYAGMFGYTAAATIQDVVVKADLTCANSIHMGAIIGTMVGGTLCNVEADGTLTGTASTMAMGGLVGKVESGVVHSSFAVNTMSTTNSNTYMGGLVGINHGNLINSYANTTMSGSSRTGGLVGENGESCLVENCYVVVDSQIFPAFAYLNKGTIKHCYADNANGYTDGGGTLESHGTFDEPLLPHTYGYMYWDNTVTLAAGETSDYVADTIHYDNNRISTWPGLLSSLNQWVKEVNQSSEIHYTHWFRPTTQHINGDLPVLGFPKDNCLATTGGKALRYSAFDSDAHSMYSTSSSSSAGSGSGSSAGNGSGSTTSGTASIGNQGFGQTPQDSDAGEEGNGLDDLLNEYENKSGYIFVYDNAIDVENVPDEDVLVFINEDVVLKQADGAGAFINATVGVSFDNSCNTATDFFGNTLAYDWHMLSTPLANAPLGISYSNTPQNWWETNDSGQVSGVENSYVPDGQANAAHWDFYSFYEPEYHWINLKRNSNSHYHYDEPHDFIEYTNEDMLVAGKGYMVAIDKDSYLLNNGTLNGPANPVSITLTKKSHDPGTEELGYNLIGNPYQAYLDVNRFLGANGLSSYWVYIAESDNYVAGNADASENPVLPSATLHPHQGFFVLANSDGQKVDFDYSTMALETPAANSYYRGQKVNYPLVNLFVTGENGKKDLAVIEFNRPEFGGSRKMHAINNANFELSAQASGNRYSILFTEEGAEKVSVNFTTQEEGTFTMTWSTYHGRFSRLFLVDNKMGIRTDMLHNDRYVFAGSPDDYASRFYITFKCTDVEEYSESEEVFVWFDGNDWIVNGKGQLQVFDVLGHVLQSQRVSGEQTRLNLEGYAAGVYMLHLTDGKTSKVQKIVVR